jgi:hypothetical protein
MKISFTKWKKPEITHYQTSFASQHSPQLNSCMVKLRAEASSTLLLAYVTIKNLFFCLNPHTSCSNNKGGFMQKIQQTKILHYTISEFTGVSDENDIKISNFTFVLFFLSVHCELLQSLSTNQCTYYTNTYFTLSGSYMFQLVANLRDFTTK